MKLRTFIVCGWILSAAVTPLFASRMQAPSQRTPAIPVGPKIRILLEKDAPSAFLEARGGYRVVRKENGSILSSGSVGKRFVVHAIQDGLRWGEEYPDIYQIALIPLSRDTTFLVNGIQYKGTISIYHVRNNNVTVVNEVAIEDYLKSTLALQYEDSLSSEAMAALVITARTVAYSKSLQGKWSLVHGMSRQRKPVTGVLESHGV